jgi:hypothetical protein
MRCGTRLPRATWPCQLVHLMHRTPELVSQIFHATSFNSALCFVQIPGARQSTPTQEKKNELPSVSFRCTLDKSLSGAYSAQALAGKMCLFRSYHLLSTTLVIVGSSLNPSSSLSGVDDSLLLSLRDWLSGSYVAGSLSSVAMGVALVGCAE